MLIYGACILLKSWNTAFLGNFQKPPGGGSSPPGDSSVLHYFGVLERGPPSGTLPAAKRRLGLFQFLGLWMKRLAGLVESPGGAGHFSDFGFFWGSGLNLIGAKVSGEP